MADNRFNETTPRLPDEYFRVPASPRIWNYWMGGKDNYEVDRDAGDAWARLYPPIFYLAQQSLQFLIRAVRYLVSDAGLRQLLDIGTGLPTVQNTHEVAESIRPDTRTVYVDNDPVVLAHARALLVSQSRRPTVDYIDRDVHEPEAIIEQARTLLNFDEPVGVMFLGMLGHVQDFNEVRVIVRSVMDATSPGSYLALWDSTDTSEGYVNAAAKYEETGAVPYKLRSPEQIGQCFDGLEMVEPGLVPITLWRPDTPELGRPQPIDGYGAVARKP